MRNSPRYLALAIAGLIALAISPTFGSLVAWEQNPLTQSAQGDGRESHSIGGSSETNSTSASENAFQFGMVAQPDLGSVLEQVSVGQSGEQEMGAPAVQSGEISLAGDAQPQQSFGARLDAWEATYSEQFPSASDLNGYQFPSAADAAGMAPGSAQTVVPAVPEFAALFPIIGLMAAVFSAELLRRRRANRVSAPHA